ncbi:sulfite exporter TauE/SafE family protein [Allostreptomyces psammosilenae]|uniref:Probable membrane transporter protein n=1 Tax=Allostreptomyces psammosilenae TaxID=1892865 RepID=A0A852ZW26_9ACTN|nr:sulfite exporter TauE/SafE family protein [Allostreptomyces psammosilenae]NYI04974.1 hypothetical protein [Allostreptomyces psammosilenae]
MQRFIIFALVGLGAQLVDGTLGMAYGVTSTTLLLIAGSAPATASAAVHLAEIGTTLASGASHWRFGNVEWRLVLPLAIPGAIGAFAGATVLSNLSTEAAVPWTSTILVVLGAYLLIRFTFRPPKAATGPSRRVGKRFLAPLGVVAGFVDSTGGGGWGPIATPTLLGTGRIPPRKVIGSVGTAEFLVAVSASVGFLLALGDENIPFVVVAGLLTGGVIAAPLAAWLVSRFPTRLLGASVGGLVVITNARTLFRSFDVPADSRTIPYILLYLVWAAALAWSIRGWRLERAEQAAQAAAGAPAEGVEAPAVPGQRGDAETAAAASVTGGDGRG